MHRGDGRGGRIVLTRRAQPHALPRNKFLVVEGAIFFPGLPFLTINPMFPVARARAARALEGRGEGRTRASALPTDSRAPPVPRV